MLQKIGIMLKISHRNPLGNSIAFESYCQKRKELQDVSNTGVVRKGVGWIPVQPEPRVSQYEARDIDRKQPLLNIKSPPC